MALKASRIDDIVEHEDGSVDVLYTHGTVPLPNEASGLGQSYSSKAALAAAIQAVEDGLDGLKLTLMLAGTAYKKDPQMGVDFKSWAKAAPFGVDLTGSSISIGTLTP